MGHGAWGMGHGAWGMGHTSPRDRTAICAIISIELAAANRQKLNLI